MTSKSYIDAVLDGDPELKVVLEHNGSVFLPHATGTLASTAGLAADVTIHHRDGRTAKVPVINLQKVSPGEGGSGFVAAFFQEAPATIEATLESMPDMELEELKKAFPKLAEQFSKLAGRFDAMNNEFNASKEKIAALEKALGVLKAGVGAAVKAVVVKAAPKPTQEPPNPNPSPEPNP